MVLFLLDESLRVKVFFDEPDCNYNDNFCISILEDCLQDKKLFIHDETNIFITPDQAKQLGQALLEAATASKAALQERCQ